uniref:NB-ARC domain-containing protein n=1 Tax=Panagrolaimus sp. JU765 TaxID=591449 RepID=A0AC34Q2J0_9BILA
MYKKIEEEAAAAAASASLKKKSTSEKVSGIVNNSRTLFIVFPTLEEFAPEREVLSSIVLPELQAYCCDRDIDLECSTFFSSNFDYGQLNFLLSTIEKGTANVLVFIGDKYGDALLPLEISQEEFNAIQSAALEFSKEQCYFADKTKPQNEYRLKDNILDPNTIEKLRNILQQGSKRAKDDGVIHQINEERQLRFYQSYIEVVANAVIESQQQHFFVIRKFQAYETSEVNDRWMEVAGSKLDAINSLKNRISSKVKEGHYFPYICNIHGYPNPQKWFKNKDSDKYKQELTAKLSSALKNLLNISSNLTATVSSYATTPMEAALREHATHEKFAQGLVPKTWFVRNDIDKKINAIVEQSMSKSCFYQFYGPAGCGKTALICRLAELFQARNCYVITRFCYLTDCSLFVNELFRNVLLKFHEMAKISSIPMMSAFHLLEILNHFKLLAEKVDRPLILLLDDVHSLKFGKALSMVEKAIKKMWPHFSMIVTATNANVYLHFLPLPENIEMALFSKDQIMEILKNQSSENIAKPTNEQLNLLRQKIKKSAGNIILAEIQYDELCEGQAEPSADLEVRLSKIESKLGAESVRIVCQLLCVLPYGLTALEVADGFRLSKRNSGMAFDPKDVLSPVPYMVLKYLGRMLVNVYTDKRCVWFFRHAMVEQVVRQRYLPSAGEVKLANETMAELLASVPSTEDEQDPVTSNLVFPHPINRENGSVNMRRIRYQWYYLLHAGKLEQLKETTLCLFNYLEACFRGCGIAHLLSIFEECSQQILDHDILVLFEQVLLPAIPTLIRDKEQFVCELLNRLRFTSSKNSERLNAVIEQLMTFADTYNRAPLLLPLTCWISPPKMKQVVSFAVPQWKSSKTVVQPTHNHQHLLISGNDSAVGQILMYHIASTLLVRTFTGHSDRVTSICTSHDGQFFTSASHDGTIKLWNFANPKGENVKTLNVCKAKLICSLLSNDDKFIVVGATDSTARVISIESGTIERAFKDHTGPVVGLQLSSDNTLLVTGSGDFVVMVWDIQIGEIIIKMSGLMAPVTCLAITSNDAFLTVACEDETVRVFSMVSSQELHELTGHEARVNALAASADDCQLFAATKGKILCYDIHNGQLLETLDCGSNLPVTSLKITDDNSFVLAACGDRIHMWNMNSIERTAPHNEKSKLSCVKLAPDERSAACGTVDSIVAFWDLDLCRCLWSTTQQKNGKVTTLDFTLDSSYVLSGTEIGQISMWDVTNGFLLKNFHIHDALLVSICCFSDGSRVLSCDQNGLMHIWNIYNNEDANSVEILSSTSGIRGPLYLSKNDSVLIGYNFKNNKEMQIWSIVENKLAVKTKVCHNEEILCYCANKSGTVLVTGSMDQSLKIWQVDSGFLTQILVGHDDVVTCCCVSEDGKLVVSGGQDKHIYIWDVQVGAVKRSIAAKSIIYAVQITHDNSVIVSADQDGWIEAWSSETSRMLSSFNTHRQIMGITVSTDASRILVLLNETAQLPILKEDETDPECIQLCKQYK